MSSMYSVTPPPSRFRRWMREIIGAPQRLIRRTTRTTSSLSRTHDSGTTDYAFWDKARTGKAKGLEISGLLLKPLYSKISSWVMGQPPIFEIKGNEQASQRLNIWWNDHHAAILKAYEDSLGLADFYLIVNADETLTGLPPNTVYPLVNDENFSDITGWRIQAAYPHPTDSGRVMRITDEFTATSRVRTVVTDKTTRTQTFRNFIKRVPIVHIPNNVGADELFGHTEGEALVTALHRYGELFDAAMDGNKHQGRPTPAIEGLGSPQEVEKFWKQYSTTVSRTLTDGTVETEQVATFDADQLIVLSGTGTFNWKSPAPFTEDTQNLLGLLFYLYIQHSEMPEWALGSAIASSRASAETQVEPLVKFIEKKRAMAELWMRELAAIVLAYAGLSDIAVRTTEAMTIRWESLTNENGELILKSLAWAKTETLVDDELALTLLPLDVPNPAATIEKARKEAEERRAEFESQQDALIAKAQQQADQQTPEQDESEAA